MPPREATQPVPKITLAILLHFPSNQCCRRSEPVILRRLDSVHVDQLADVIRLVLQKRHVTITTPLFKGIMSSVWKHLI